ncbi:MAG: hypothetical protein HQM10_08200 [Candidatus Riflebacteria bacterium]|nr:hypothetical protein [Candidatus Riflebacteria bacterium]
MATKNLLEKYRITDRRKQGIAMLFALLAVVSLGIIVFWYNKFSMQLQFQAYREEQLSMLRQVANSAAEEAICQLQKLTVRGNISAPPNKYYDWAIKRNGSVDIPITETEKIASPYLKTGQSLELKATARHVLFRDTDNAGKLYLKYTAPDGSLFQEGVGTYQLEVRARILGGYLAKKPSCTIIRHHDLKIVSMVSPRDSNDRRTFYAANFPLDYALLVRNAYSERINSPDNINREVRIIIKQSHIGKKRRGKVYLGETASSGNYLSINTNEHTKAIVPYLPPQIIHKIELDECSKLSYRISQDENNLKGLVGIFERQNEPAEKNISSSTTDAILNTEFLARGYVARATVPDQSNFIPGLDILGREHNFLSDPDNSKEIIEGDLRQRFFSFVHFYFDASNCTTATNDQKAQLATYANRFPCVPVCPVPNIDAEAEYFFNGLDEIESDKPSGVSSLISDFCEEYPYQANLSGLFPPSLKIVYPSFFSVNNTPINSTENTTAKCFRPYNHFNLFNLFAENMDEAIRLGIYDPVNGILNLSGIVLINDAVTLGSPRIKSLTIHGQGVLICANGEIKILSGIKKRQNSDDLCVLVAREGAISVHTSELIEASLISVINESKKPSNLTNRMQGRIIAKRPLNLKGAVVVDILKTKDWEVGEHYLEYDEYLKQLSEPVFCVNYSPRISFERISESDY